MELLKNQRGGHPGQQLKASDEMPASPIRIQGSSLYMSGPAKALGRVTDAVTHGELHLPGFGLPLLWPKDALQASRQATSQDLFISLIFK